VDKDLKIISNKITEKKLKNKNDTKISSDISYKESKSFMTYKNSITNFDKDFKANYSVIIPIELSNKNKKTQNSIPNLQSKNSSNSKLSNQSFSFSESKKNVNERNNNFSSFQIKQLNNYKNDKKTASKISKSKSDLNTLSSPSKSKTQILSSPLVSSPVSSPIHESEFKVSRTKSMTSTPLNKILKQSKVDKSLNITSSPNSKKLSHILQNSLLHTPSKLSIKSSTKLNPNQSFTVANNSKKRTQTFHTNVNESFIDNKSNIIKKVKLNSNTEEKNKTNKTQDTKILSTIKEESNTNKIYSKDDNGIISTKKDDKSKISNVSKESKDKDDKDKNNSEKKEINSCPHYLIPTANWKTKAIKQNTDKDKSTIGTKLSSRYKVKTAIKILNMSKLIKKKNSNNSSIKNTTALKNTSNYNDILVNSTINPVNSGTKSSSHHIYTHKNSKINSLDSKYSVCPIINRSKTLSNFSFNKVTPPSTSKENKKEKSNKKVTNRSATLPMPTPSKRINKNIKRNNVAFTEENEQDINRMFISAETLKSTSIDSFFNHYNSTNNEKRDQHR